MNYEFQITNRQLQMIAGSRHMAFGGVEERSACDL